MTARSFSKLNKDEQEAARVEARKLIDQIRKVMSTDHHPFVWQLVLTDCLTFYVAAYEPSYRERALQSVVDGVRRMYPKVASVLWKGSTQ
jgi:hypothetical protein